MLLSVIMMAGAPQEVLVDTGFAGVDPTSGTAVANASRQAQASIRIKTDAQVANAEGDTDAALIYSDQGLWVENFQGDATLYECRLEEDSTSGSTTHTWSGSAIDTWHSLTGNITFTMTIDGTSISTSNAEVTLRVREIAVPANEISRSAVTLQTELTA